MYCQTFRPVKRPRMPLPDVSKGVRRSPETLGSLSFVWIQRLFSLLPRTEFFFFFNVGVWTRVSSTNYLHVTYLRKEYFMFDSEELLLLPMLVLLLLRDPTPVERIH